MSLLAQLQKQRLQYIVDSYNLAGAQGEAFASYLQVMMQAFPAPLLELAIVDTLVDHWLSVPLVRGVAFLEETYQKLQMWEQQSIANTITPDQFQQLTGLDPTPVFGLVQSILSTPKL
ncbi:MAG: hypothetical protein NZ772_12995 [Cyanobacteria bacterium]|nr:hypothetical protein [Cyanobacteriota bacterium]MDW8202295.1 hypothetical protein [Cyanobacteriota bacterium SKYGB_h_bin112]